MIWFPKREQTGVEAVKLGIWLRQHEVKQIEFARAIGCGKATISAYVSGTRTPTGYQMREIYRATLGAVTPNDFYPIADWQAELVAPSSTCAATRAANHQPAVGGAEGETDTPSASPSLEAAE